MNKLVIAILFFSVYSCHNNDNGDSIKPKLTDITESVYASIRIEPALSYFLQPTQSGIIKEIFVKEGDVVEKGQKIFQISIPSNVESRLSNAKLNLQEAKANYEGANNLLLNVEAEIQSAKAQLSFDSLNFKRYERLWSQDIGKESEFEKAKLAYENAKNQVAILKQRKEQTTINLKSNYQKMVNLADSEVSQFGDFTVRSELGGMVYSVNKEVGDFINTLEHFAEIGSNDSFLIMMDIDEVDITKINLQDSVIIALDAHPDKYFKALVHKIYPKKEESTQTFKVESLFIPPLPKLYNGLSGEANIIVDKRKNALVIPSDYLMPDNMVNTTDGVTPVNIGIKNLDYVEILSGVDTATIILKPAK